MPDLPSSSHAPEETENFGPQENRLEAGATAGRRHLGKRLWRPIALQAYRLAALALIVLLIREHRDRLRIDADAPVTVKEILNFYPQAERLEPDKEKMGLAVRDAGGNLLGYVVRTRPFCDAIIGYSGPTDTLIAFDSGLPPTGTEAGATSSNPKVLGIQIRSSPDTFNHVADVNNDAYFMTLWNGKNWDEVANLDIHKAGIEGVSGATLTSMSIAQSITQRLKDANKARAEPPPVSFRARDIGMICALAAALVIAFTSLRGRRWLRRLFQVLVIGYVGLVNGDLLSQSLLLGWSASGVAWRIAPGLALLAAAALLVPWATKKALYCQHLCPHGAAQELLDRICPRRLRIHVPRSLAAGLRWLPLLLLMVAVGATMLVLPLDLAEIEPFDAYLIHSAGWATIAIAALGLLAAPFVPMAYCKFGCPTGALLEFLRSHGRNDSFGKRDIAALALVLLTAALYFYHATLKAWIAGIG